MRHLESKALALDKRRTRPNRRWTPTTMDEAFGVQSFSFGQATDTSKPKVDSKCRLNVKIKKLRTKIQKKSEKGKKKRAKC
ncbi:hypothetical protein PN36_32485 [Candidatus Thiomargarita nelsonii]|uniref:Uncharacterized protein n=1 Tax=Candidatus Thiomargarita nelsonii TaxID=1003181 RepID=A0A4E0QNL4_9GAMM|nr:hypothetical protein PN36_32485 [Candidatus Thiomargarita nelsonii]